MRLSWLGTAMVATALLVACGDDAIDSSSHDDTSSGEGGDGGSIGSPDSGSAASGTTTAATSGSSTSSSGTGATSGTSTTGSGGTTSSGTGGSGFEPDPIPDVPDELPPPCDAANASTYYYEFLDDTCGVKRLPAIEDRAFACPVVDDSATIALEGGGGTVTYQPTGASIEVDATALEGIVPSDMRVAVILIRRVGGVPHYRYLSNGTHDEAIQPWSTTKFLAAANAAATLRIKSNYKVGLTASVGGLALGDLATSLVSYDDDPYSSNAVGAYFHNIGGRNKANDLIHGAWLNRPSTETFGGNYGQSAPALGYTFVEADASSVTVTPDGVSGIPNKLSMFTLAEAMKRLVLHREEPTTRLPGIQWKDLEVLLYGAEGSSKGPFGGLSRDPAVYLQSGHDIEYLAERSKERFRIFSKLGAGTTSADGVFHFLDVGYACFPVLDDDLEPVPGWGREFVIAAELGDGGQPYKARDRQLATAYRAIVERIIDGRL
jgi:hypothetical protein